MSDSGLDALAAEQAVEAKLAEVGADQLRHHTFPETPEAAPEGTPADETPRNELGQFVSTEEPEAEVVSADQAMGDPAVSAFLNKYGGDVDKALAGAVHLQKKAGQQSNEIGEMRRMVDELARLSTTIQQGQQPQQAQQQYVDQATVDWYDQQIMENPHQALEWARQNNNQLLVQRGLSVWKDLDPYEAAVYTNRLENQTLHAQMQQQLAAAAQIPTQTKVQEALNSVLADNPHFVNYDLEETLQKHPFAAQAMASATSTGDPGQIKGAIQTLYSLAVGDTLQQIAQTPTTGDTVTTSDVVTPTTSETRDPAPVPTQTDLFREQFRQESERKRKGVWVAE